MKEIITYEESPIPIPHPDEAWADMRHRLRDSDPAAAAPEQVPIPADTAAPQPTATASRHLAGIRTAATIMLLLLSALYPLRLVTPSVRHQSAIRSKSIPAAHYITSALPPEQPAPVQLHFHPKFLISPSAASDTDSPAASSPNHPWTGISLPMIQDPVAPTNSSSKRAFTPTPSAHEAQPETGTVHLETQYLTLQLGLQWTAQIPTGSAHAYLDGTNGHSHFYRLLLPAAWMHLQWDKSLLEFTIDPFYSTLVPLKPYSQDTLYFPGSTSYKTQSLSKLFGFAVSAGYSGNLDGRWWAGGGIRTIWWSQAIVSISTLTRSQPASGPAEFSNISTTAALFKYDWHYFSKFQLDLYTELLYNSPAGHAGLRIGFPFSILSRDQGPTRPLRLELFYRLPLLTRHVRAAAAPPE